MDHNRKPKVLFVLGGPGSGKGTQCINLVQRYKFQHLSAGDLLRAEIKRQSSLSKEIDNYVSKGLMVPGEITVRLLRQAMEERGWGRHVFIIDGFPRNLSNLDIWEQNMKDEIDVLGTLFLTCSEDMMHSRIMKRGETSGRSDDNEETFRARIRVYIEETTPVIDHFRSIDRLYEVSAEGTVEECSAECRSVIESLNIDRIEELNEIRSFLHDRVDPYVKPLISYLMKNKPQNVHGAIKYWLENEGEEIRKAVEK